jgi:hypothetical protein
VRIIALEGVEKVVLSVEGAEGWEEVALDNVGQRRDVFFLLSAVSGAWSATCSIIIN